MKLQRIIRLSVSMIIITSIFTPSGVFSVQADAPDLWWDEDLPYRMPVTVEGSGVTSVNLDFSSLLSSLGLEGALLDLRSIRVVPIRLVSLAGILDLHISKIHLHLSFVSQDSNPPRVNCESKL
ncbi:MAG: hypothetical protein ACTSQ8_25360 [Candidatus Helarchaeota archaeon]